ncbi:MAG: glutathione peroxidase [Flavisolibacter sp.]|nr:glutathione peroxidase [Flavisolibacter sp.]
MTARQHLLRIIYPFWILVNRMLRRKAKILYNEKCIAPVTSLFDLTVTFIDGNEVKLHEWKGKKLLLVNTASDCGYTAQYSELQQLYQIYRDKLMIIGFPSNDYKEQEKDDDKAIAEFCSVHYGVRFPLVKKSVVVKTERQHPVFQWLSHASKNGWSDQPPTWNFSKYLINEQGMLTHYFDPSVTPLSPVVLNAIHQ